MAEKSNRVGTSPWIYGILIAGVALRLTGLTVSAFHYDEAFSLTMARQDLFEMVRNLTENISPPGWEILVWFTSHLLGYNEFSARLIPLLASVATLWVAFRLTQELQLSFSHQVIGLGLLAFLPYQFWLAQEARTYAVYEFLYTLGILWAIRRRWLGLTAVMGLMLWFHNTAVFYVPTLALIALARQPRAWKSIFAVGLVAGLSWLIWLPSVFSQSGQPIPWFPPFTLAHVATNLEAAFFANALSSGWAIFGLLAVLLSSAAVFVRTFSQTFDWLFHRKQFGDAVSSTDPSMGVTMKRQTIDVIDPRINPNFALMLAVVVPLLLFVLFTLLKLNVFLFRPLSAMVPAWVIWLAPTITFPTSRTQKLRIARVILTALWTWTMLSGLAGWSPQRTSDMLDIVAMIRSNWQTGDILYQSSALSANLFQFYLPGYDQYLIDKNGIVEKGIATLLKLNLPEAALEDIPYRRAWVVWLRDVNAENERMGNYVKECQMVGSMFFWQASQITEVYACRKP